MPRGYKRKPSPEYKIQTVVDGQEHIISKSVINQMNVLKDILVDLDASNSEPAPVQHVTSEMFKICVDFCELHKYDSHYESRDHGPCPLMYKDYIFLKEHEHHFPELLTASDYLWMPRLIDAILAYIREYYVVGHTRDSLSHNLGLDLKPKKPEQPPSKIDPEVTARHIERRLYGS